MSFLSPEKEFGACILISPCFWVSSVSLEDAALDILGFVSGSGSWCSGASSNNPSSDSDSVSVSLLDDSESDSIGARNVLLLLDVVVSNKFGSKFSQWYSACSFLYQGCSRLVYPSCTFVRCRFWFRSGSR